MGRTKRKRKEDYRGEAEMGYCPFPALGRDTVDGVATWAAGLAQTRHPAEQERGNTVATRAAARTTWAGCACDMGQAVRCHDTQFGVTTWLAGWVSRHTPWCHDMKAAGRATLVS